MANDTGKLLSNTLFQTAKKEADIGEIIYASRRLLDRYSRFLVIEDKYLPDDCLGIFIVRPEDAENFRKRKP